jgi:hypothetical protein
VRAFIVVFTFVFFLPRFSTGQTQDTTAFETIDSVTHEVLSEADQKLVVYDAPSDSLAIESRQFGTDKLNTLKDDPALQYKIPPTVAESLWDRFIYWLGYILREIFNSALNTNWGNVIAYAIGIALVVLIIMMILKVNAFRILYSSGGARLKHQVLDENIHEMDFDKLIQEAEQMQDYRRGVRLLFLYALKILSDKHLIHWESGKTNHEYVSELQSRDLKTGLNELSFYFDYAWYGNFRITSETFNKAHDIFTNWKGKVS